MSTILTRCNCKNKKDREIAKYGKKRQVIGPIPELYKGGLVAASVQVCPFGGIYVDNSFVFFICVLSLRDLYMPILNSYNTICIVCTFQDYNKPVYLIFGEYQCPTLICIM